jgi:predicted ATPase
VDVPGELIGIAPSLVSGRIIGRSAELGVVRGAVEAAARGGHCVMVVAGEAGIGKSALRRVAVRRACELGMTVLAGRAVEGDPRGPYAAIAEAVGRGLAGAPWLNERSLVPLRSTLAQIVPEFSADARGRPPVATVAEALLRLLKLTAQQQASILVVEDLQWADPESLATLAHLVDNIAPGAFVVRRQGDLHWVLRARRRRPCCGLPAKSPTC